MMRRCADCPRLIPSGKRRCAPCMAAYEAKRGTPAQRGYGAAHQRARAMLAATLPAVCGGDMGAPYCGRWITPADKWVAAHRVDGRPEYGYVHAHPACNERAKVRGGDARTGERPDAIPAPTALGLRTGPRFGGKS